MRHLILVKLHEGDPAAFAREIEPLFVRALAIEGVERVRVTPACITAPNRFDVMIEMELTREGLCAFDASQIHSEWKRRWAERLESKAVFDCE